MSDSLHPSVIFNFLIEKCRLYNFRARIASGVLYKKAKGCKGIVDYITVCNETFERFPWRYKVGQLNLHRSRKKLKFYSQRYQT